MNVDLTNTFKDARGLINTWKRRYSKSEYPEKVIINIFYRKYTIEAMWEKAIQQNHSTWQIAYNNNLVEYANVAQNTIVPVLKNYLRVNRKVTSICYSDFASYINTASRGNEEAIKAIEYTYFLHRILDDLNILWISMVNSGETPTNAIQKLTGAIFPNGLPINSYAEVENILDQLGAERYLQSLFMKEHTNQL
jgi:hypothetical protein